MEFVIFIDRVDAVFAGKMGIIGIYSLIVNIFNKK
jgi:hypothetical protein